MNGIKKSSIDVISDNLATYIGDIKKIDTVDGIFIAPDDSFQSQQTFKIGVVHTGDAIEDIMNVDRFPLRKAVYYSNCKFDVVPISYDWFRKVNGIYPARELLKSGHILFDRKGSLALLRDRFNGRFKGRNNVNRYFDSELEFVMQYVKK